MGIRIVHRSSSAEVVVEVDIDDPSRPVVDLLGALGCPTPADGFVVIDGEPVTVDLPLSAVTMCEGSVVDTTTRPAATVASARTVTVTGGLRAGAAVAIAQRTTIGRSDIVDFRIDDPAMSAAHLSFSVSSVRDQGSRNGTSIEGRPLRGSASLELGASVRAGATRFALRDPVDDRPVAVATALGAVGGIIPFNRPPRVEPVADEPVLMVPGAAAPAPTSEPLSIAGIVLPVIAGGIVAVLFSPFMAVFAALGPVLTVGMWWERRRRARRAHRAEMRTNAVALTRLRLDLPDRRVSEVARRRELHPDLAEVVRRARMPSVRCWERRPAHDDAFIVALGGDDERFDPPLSPTEGEAVAPESAELVEALALMPDVPIPLDLSAGRVVGLVGDRTASLAVARSLILQMATHHGPADLGIAVGADRRADWEWCRWLPHTSDHASGRLGANVLDTTEVDAADSVIAGVGERTLLAVLDGADPFQGRATVGRRILACANSAAIVLVADSHRLPSGCNLVVTVDGVGRMRVVDPSRAGLGRGGLAWGLDLAIATSAARRLARLDDPELPVAGAGVPAVVPLLSMLGLRGDEPSEIEGRWSRRDGSAGLVVPIGADGEGPVMLDLVADGPHVLIGGTTGSGKSELLRSLVAAVAASADPDHVAMVLVDYKGGAAFDCCADLPHVAGLVTDLDDTLAARALRCLDAELRYREHRLREVGAEDLRAFRALADDTAILDPLPRLLVVVDEFASLATDLPDFLDALLGIAQRGRSLGVHLILATQRPAGVVTDDIRANASCRIALRVTDRNDSVDVIGAPDAAAISRGRPGRAVARFGPGELVAFQSALATGHSSGRAGVSVCGAIDGDGDGPNDLRRLVDTISSAHTRRNGRRPRSPWPPQLPERLHRGEATTGDIGAGDWFLVDDPDRQRQVFGGWQPSDGHLVVVGGPGSGATTTLATAVMANTRGLGGAAPHVHVIDLAGGHLGPLASLPAVGSMVGPTERVRRGRLIRWIDEEVARRRGAPEQSHPPMVLVIDDFGGLARAHDPVRDAVTHDRLSRVWADGPSVGVIAAVSLRRSADLAPDLVATVGTVLVHRTADQSDALRFSMKTSTERFPAGRAVRSGDGATIQVVLDAPSITEAVQLYVDDEPPAVRPHEVGELRSRVLWHDLVPSVHFGVDDAHIGIGLRDRDLEPATIRLHHGEHALVLGPARSGRTNALATIARAAGEHALVVGDGELARRRGLDPLSPSALESAIQGRGASLVLIDDCLDVDDPSGFLARLVASAPVGVHVIASARADRYRSSYGHWATDIRSSRVGLLLQPDPIDGDLLGQQLPARLDLPQVAGRGVVIAGGRSEIVQVVLADDQVSTE